MNIQPIGIWNSLSLQDNLNLVTKLGNGMSFLDILSGVTETSTTEKDDVSAFLYDGDIRQLTGTGLTASEIWKKNIFGNSGQEKVIIVMSEEMIKKMM